MGPHNNTLWKKSYLITSCILNRRYRLEDSTQYSTPQGWILIFCDFYKLLLAVWMLGAGINFLLFNVIKISVGRLRPNFIAMCQPYTNVTNAKDCLINNSNYFFPGDLFKCNKTNDMNNPRIVDGRCSFYSGHSALSIYFAVFIIVCFFLFFWGFCGWEWVAIYIPCHFPLLSCHFLTYLFPSYGGKIRCVRGRNGRRIVAALTSAN